MFTSFYDCRKTVFFPEQHTTWWEVWEITLEFIETQFWSQISIPQILFELLVVGFSIWLVVFCKIFLSVLGIISRTLSYSGFILLSNIQATYLFRLYTLVFSQLERFLLLGAASIFIWRSVSVSPRDLSVSGIDGPKVIPTFSHYHIMIERRLVYSLFGHFVIIDFFTLLAYGPKKSSGLNFS